MNNLANMMRGGMTTQPNGQPFGTAQQTTFRGATQTPQVPQFNGFGGQPTQGFQHYAQAAQARQPQNQWQPDGSRIDAWKQAHPGGAQNWAGQQGFGGWSARQGGFNPPQFGGGNGYFDGDLGRPDQGWKPWGGW